MFGWQLAIPTVTAALLWFFGRGAKRPQLDGMISGLLFSIPTAITLSWFLASGAANVLNLPIVH
jgi:hypothetical protein